MKEVLLYKFDNKWYQPAGLFKKTVWFFVNILFFLNPISVYSPIKVWILILFGAKVGRRVLIKPRVNIKYPWYLTIGDDVWIGEGVWIDNLTAVQLDSNVCISQGAMLLTGNHNYKSESFDLILGSIVIEKGVWIGAKSVVCPGVTCKSHSILTVGSVATKSLESYSIYQGNPAVKVRERVFNQ
ncbi:WcaF family extracellular polysaccharide biosynthesis acetyltransferase [Mongoliitalea lutea]|uniref:Colanic acid biosynthesis acetyltransferase WcaF n=1 Tax=Mongoliitalea lutea TaxID=849756 RepID=A0A8J3CW16_9BACT|nr:WcaF family extracellular polysaccharide biosynthesis acetyltransferase [Mongoliitalea lutea]GHB37062.1 colanic acid biosynthesis acetyltransferase WcaF [Mongoliitalea lutea]